MKTDFKRINAAALSSIDAVLNRWLPGGKMHGHEYQAINPTRPDSKLGSFSINCTSGAWADFASDDKGGDLVALVAYLDGVKQGEAAKRLAEFLGLQLEKTDPAERATSDSKQGGNTIPQPNQTNPRGVRCYPCRTMRRRLTLRTRNTASLRYAGSITTRPGSCFAVCIASSQKTMVSASN